MEVLIIDDDRELRSTVADILQEAGHQVASATSAEEALVRLKSGYRPALIIIDYLMPRMSGVQFLATCRLDPALQQIPAVLISGTTPDAASVARTGAAAALQKPFTGEALLALVERLTGTGGGETPPAT